MKKHPRVRTEALEIVDKSGTVRMVLTTQGSCPIIEMFDASGGVRAVLYVSQDGEPGLALGQSAQNINLLAYVDRAGCPQIRMRHPELEHHVVISCKSSPSVVLNDGTREITVTTPTRDTR